MGLKELTSSDLKKAHKIIAVLEFYGVTEDDIPLIAEIKNLRMELNDIKKIIKNEYTNNQKSKENKVFSKDQILKAYLEPQEEFIPNGKKANN